MSSSDIPRQPRVYLAGPDVFERDSARTFTQLSRLAHEFGLSPIVPMEGWGCVEVKHDDGASLAQRIFAANIARLDSAQGVIANLRDFRGTEPDAGTVFEVGYAHARGIPIVGYGVPARSYAARVGDREACERVGGTLREVASGREVEDFGQSLNLMLACSVELVADATAAMAALAARLHGALRA